MINPLCPHCQTKASEHEDNLCLIHWLNDIAGKTITFFTPIAWAYAGPLLEEMKEDDSTIGIVLTSVSDSESDYTLSIATEEGDITSSNCKLPLTICRAYLIWKANTDSASVGDIAKTITAKDRRGIA